MATGRLGTADLAAATDTSLYTVPNDTFTVASVSLLNRGNATREVRLAVCDTATAEADEYLEYGALLGAGDVLERTGIVIDAGKQIVVWASDVNVTAVAFGIETASA
jgi:hypothetical protein